MHGRLPADFLSLERIWPNVQFQIYGDQIWTYGSSPIQMSYRSQLPVSRWPVYFRVYAEYELARRMAFAVAESADLEKRLEANLIEKRAMAMFIDAQNHPGDQIQYNPWISIRGGWY